MQYTEEQIQSVFRQYQELKMQRPGLLLLCHWGDSVELYNRDADRFSALFGLPQTESARLKGEDGIPWRKVSFPATELQGYMDRLELNGVDFTVSSAIDAMPKKRESIEETTMETRDLDGYGTQESLSTVFLRHDLRTDCVQAILPNGETGAFILPDRSVSYAKNAHFTGIQRQEIERTAHRENFVVQGTGGRRLAFCPLDGPQFIYDNPKEESSRKVIAVEKVDGISYAVHGRDIIGEYDNLKGLLRPDTEAARSEIAERSDRYLSVFRYRLYEAFLQGDPVRISQAERAVHAAYRYALQDGYDGASVQEDINRLRHLATQDEWLIYADEGERTFMVYAKLDEKEKFRPINLETGKLVGIMDRATHIPKNDLEIVLQVLQSSLSGNPQLQVRDTVGKVYYDTCFSAAQMLRVSEEFSHRHKAAIMFTPNERTYGIDISTREEGTFLHIRPDRQVERRGDYRVPAADMDCIRNFAHTDNMLFQSNEGWMIALEPLNEPSKYFNDPAACRRFPVSVEQIEGSACAIHNHRLVARGEQVSQLPDLTPEVVARFDEAARNNYERCKMEVIRAAVRDDIQAEEVAFRRYLDAEKYLYTDRYSRHEAGERLRLIQDAVRETLNLVRKDRHVGQGTEELTPQHILTNGPEVPERQEPMQETLSGMTGKKLEETAGQGTAREPSGQQQGKEGGKSEGKTRAESRLQDNILVFKMDDGHYGIYEIENGTRSRTRRLSDEDTQWFFNGIKDLTPQQQLERRQALARKYIRQGYAPQPQKPYFPDVPEAIRRRIGEVRVFRVGTGNYNVRAVIDGEQHTGKLMRKADNSIFFDHYTNKPKEVREETLVRLAALYFREELREQRLDFDRGMHR